MEEKRLESRIFKFAISVAKFVGALPSHGTYSVIYKQLLRSALSIGANWQEAVGGLTDADFTHSVNIAKKEAMETAYWLKVMMELGLGDAKEVRSIHSEACEIVSILVSIVKKVQGRSRKKTLKAVAVLLCSLILNPLSFIPSYAADWPTFMGNDARTGFTHEQAYPPLSPVWSFDVQGDVVAGPVVYGGIVYATSRSDTIYALDAFTGELIWDYSSDGWIDSSPAVSSSAVLMSGRDGRLYALDRLTGDILWQAELGAPSASSPLILDGKVYVGVGIPVKKLKAFELSSGAPLWEKQASQAVDSAPSSDGSHVYFGSNDGRLYAADAATGADAWATPYHQTIGSYGFNSVAVSGGSLYALPGHDERKLFRMLTADGSQAAVTEPFAELAGEASENEVTSPVVSPYGIFAGAGSVPHAVYAFNPSSLADISFSSPTAGNTSSFGRTASPAMANGVLYFATADARLIAVSSSGAVLPGTITLSSSSYASPAVSNGFVYTGVMGGKVLAYKASLIASISAPRSHEVVDGTVSVYGCIKNPALTGYTLEYGEGEEPASWSVVASSPASSEISGGLLGQWDTSQLANGLYALRLTVSESAPSGTLTEAVTVTRVNHLPQPPSALSAADEPADSGNRLRLNWSPSPSSWVSAYRIYRGVYGGEMSLLTQISTPAVTHLDATAATGVTYTYSVTAFDGYSESTASNRASAASVNNNPSSDMVPPAAPVGVSAEPGEAGGTIALAWTAPGNDDTIGEASGYEIRRATYAAFAWDAGVVWKSGLAASGPYGTAEAETVTGLYGGTTHYFLIKAYDANANYSPVSIWASAWAGRDLVPPGPPSRFQVADKPGDHGGELVLSWGLSPDDGAGAGDVYGYKIYRAPSSGGQLPDSPHASVGPGYSVYTDTSATENIRFYYTLAAYDSTNISTMTEEASGVSADNWRFFDASSGGTVRLADGAEVAISESAVSQNDNILVVRRESADYFGPSVKVKADTGGAVPTGIVYEIKFEHPATKLLKSVTISLPYTSPEIGSIPEADLRMYTLQGSRWALLNTSRVVKETARVEAETTHFSIFSVMGYVPSGPLLSKDSVYTYPNPAKGDSLTFKFRPADKSRVTIDVYNIAGEKVARLEKADCPAGLTSEIVWDVKRIASGVYQYKVEAESASSTKSLIKRLAIIH